MNGILRNAPCMKEVVKLSCLPKPCCLTRSTEIRFNRTTLAAGCREWLGVTEGHRVKIKSTEKGLGNTVGGSQAGARYLGELAKGGPWGWTPAPAVDFSGTFSPNAPTPPSVHGPRNHRPDPITFCLVLGTSRSILGKIPVPVPIGGLAPPLYALPARDVCLFKRTAMPWSKGTDFRPRDQWA